MHPMAETVRVLGACAINFRDREPARELVEQAGFEFVSQLASAPWPDDETRDKLAGIDGIIAGGESFTHHTMEKAADLKIVARNGVGYDRVDVGACSERGVVVTNTPGAMADAVADHAMALLLASVRHIIPGDRAVKAGEYQVAMGEDLCAMTLGLLGCGHIGAETVHRALGFKMRVLVYDPYVDPERIAELGAVAVSREQLLAEADVISLHLPMSDENAGLVNAEFLRSMKPGSYLINTARGGLVDEPALIDALQSGQLAGAGLDCQASEPPEGVSLQLSQLPNVIAMPHSASRTLTARERMSVAAARCIVTCLQGRVPDFVVNPEVLEKLDLR